MTGEFATRVRIGIGAMLLLTACGARDVIVRRLDAAAVSEAMRSWR
jgi:hypothetical protein